MYQVPHDPRRPDRSPRAFARDLVAMLMVGFTLLAGMGTVPLAAKIGGLAGGLTALALSFAAPVGLAQYYSLQKQAGRPLRRAFWMICGVFCGVVALLVALGSAITL